MDPKAVVKQRLEEGRTAGPYTELIDLHEVEQLANVYLTMNDGEPDTSPPPESLTSQQFKHYVRLVYEAIKSTDMAVDAFNIEDRDTHKSTPMKYIDSLNMFEIQLVAGKLVKTVHRLQGGTITTPSWLVVSSMKFHKYSSK
jgi:hypothetical protein